MLAKEQRFIGRMMAAATRDGENRGEASERAEFADGPAEERRGDHGAKRI